MRRFAVLLATAMFANVAAQADEGMWTYDNFPSARVQAQYGVKIDQPWLDRVRTATVRLAGCTASFVSPEGLILTNHHCVEGCLAENSSKEKSLIEDGFIAQTREQELKCATQLADVLVEMENVTAKIDAATKGLDDRAANDARKRTLTELETACEKTSGLKCQTVPVQISPLHRRTPGVRAGSGDRGVRRRPGQLPVSALVPRHGLAARL